MSTENKRELAGVIGFFKEPHELVEAMSKVREAKYQEFDAFTPYPVHGLEKAQGLRRSPLPPLAGVRSVQNRGQFSGVRERYAPHWAVV